MNPQPAARNPGHVAFNQDQLRVADYITDQTGLDIYTSTWLGLQLVRRIADQVKIGKAGWIPPFKLSANGQSIKVWVGELPTRSPVASYLIFGLVVGAFILGIVIGRNSGS